MYLAQAGLDVPYLVAVWRHESAALRASGAAPTPSLSY
jgi:hypothetical protein